MSPSVSIKKTIRGSVPHIPFDKITRAVLGARYELSLVICGDALAKRMNKAYRKRNYSPNVLSFPLSKNDGEIFLNVRKAAREASYYYDAVVVRGEARKSSRVERSRMIRNHIAFLFVHGCFHLKGLDHGRTMERQEQRTLRAFHFSCNAPYTQE